MKICDRGGCGAAAVDTIVLEMDDQHFDVCASCRQVVLETLTMRKPESAQDMTETPSTENRKNKGGRPKKNG